jgi:hypothetical protein
MQGWLLFEALCPGACNLFPRLWPMSAAAAASGDAEEQLLAQLQVQQRAATSLRSLTRPSAGCSHRTAHANSKASSRRGAVLQRVVSAAAYGSVVSGLFDSHRHHLVPLSQCIPDFCSLSSGVLVTSLAGAFKTAARLSSRSPQQRVSKVGSRTTPGIACSHFKCQHGHTLLSTIAPSFADAPFTLFSSLTFTPSFATSATVLVPLTSSLYVRGNLENVAHPMVEIGTG